MQLCAAHLLFSPRPFFLSPPTLKPPPFCLSLFPVFPVFCGCPPLVQHTLRTPIMQFPFSFCLCFFPRDSPHTPHFFLLFFDTCLVPEWAFHVSPSQSSPSQVIAFLVVPPVAPGQWVLHKAGALDQLFPIFPVILGGGRPHPLPAHSCCPPLFTSDPPSLQTLSVPSFFVSPNLLFDPW